MSLFKAAVADTVKGMTTVATDVAKTGFVGARDRVQGWRKRRSEAAWEINEMVSKKIDLGGGLKFESITSGRMHFAPILKDAELGEYFAGKEFQEIKSLYDAYCRKTG